MDPRCNCGLRSFQEFQELNVKSVADPLQTAQHGKSGTDGELGHGDTAAYKQPKLVTAFEGLKIMSVACGADFTVCASGKWGI